MYCIPCECGKVYVGHTSRTIETRCQEYTPAPWPDRKVTCSRTPTKHRIWNPIRENSQTEQEDQIHGPDCERRNRNSTTCRKCQQGDWLYVKSYMAAGSQFTEMLSTTRNRQPRPHATTFWLLPLTRGVTFHPVTGQMEIHSAELDT